MSAGGLPAPSSFKHDLVLVVEDSKANSMAISALLRKLVFDVLEFRDGSDAWDWLKALPAPEAERIKAIFSDVNMPKMNGLELLRHVRTIPALKNTCFVFTSAVIDPPVVREARALNSDGYIVKPVMPSVLQKKLDELFPDRSNHYP